MKSLRPLLCLLALLPSCAAPEPAPASTSPDLIGRMEDMTRDIPRLAWDVLTEESGGTAMDAGYKVQGRFVRGEGVRIKATAMGSAHGMGHGSPPGPNLHQLILTRDRVAVALSVLSFESGRNTECFPHLLFRAAKGEPDHEAVEPRLLPGNDPIMLRFHEPLVAYQLAPRIVLGHEPGLAPVGTEKVRGADCLVFRSSYATDAAARRGPAGWYPVLGVEKRIFIDARTNLLAALETTVTFESGSRRMRHEVVKRQPFRGVDLPRFVEIREEGPHGIHLALHRVDLDPGDT